MPVSILFQHSLRIKKNAVYVFQYCVIDLLTYKQLLIILKRNCKLIIIYYFSLNNKPIAVQKKVMPNWMKILKQYCSASSQFFFLRLSPVKFQYGFLRFEPCSSKKLKNYVISMYRKLKSTFDLRTVNLFLFLLIWVSHLFNVMRHFDL